jgi:integrase
MATTSPLRQRMIEDMTIRNLSRATQQSYIYAVAKFSRHFNLSPDRLGMEEIRAYQLHFVAEKHSWGRINQITCALRFFYGITLGQKEAIERIVFGREPEKLPPVLNADEITRFLEAVAGQRGRASEGRLDRQRADADPRRGRQRRQGPLRHAVAAALGDPSGLLAASEAKSLAVSRPGTRRTCEHRRLAGRLPGGAPASQDQQARHRPCAAA